MGWASGSGLFSQVANILEESVGDPDARFYIYLDLISAFEEYDCDNLDECAGIDEELDKALIQTGYIEE